MGGTVIQSLAGLPAFVAYFCLSIVAVIAYLFFYTRATPYNEFELIEKNTPGAAIALGLSLIGFCLPVASAVAHAADLLDCAVWAVVAFIVQVGTFYAARIAVSDLCGRIARGEMASAIWLGFIYVATGILSAASMTW